MKSSVICNRDMQKQATHPLQDGIRSLSAACAATLSWRQTPGPANKYWTKKIDKKKKPDIHFFKRQRTGPDLDGSPAGRLHFTHYGGSISSLLVSTTLPCYEMAILLLLPSSTSRTPSVLCLWSPGGRATGLRINLSTDRGETLKPFQAEAKAGGRGKKITFRWLASGPCWRWEDVILSTKSK